MSTALDLIEEGATALAETQLRKALHLRRARRDVSKLCEIGKRLDSYLVNQVASGTVGAAELLLELRDSLQAVGGAT